MDEPRSVTPSALGDEAMSLYAAAQAQGLTLRLIGSLAVQLVCPTWRHLAVDLGRRPTGDIDFVGYAKESARLEALFDTAGYSVHPAVRYSQEFGVKRLIFVPASGTPKVDVFLDELIMAHTIGFAGRLDLDAPTVSLVDLLLSKLQIHEMTRNDLIDLSILLAEHGVGSGAGEISGDYFARVMGRDWGFYQTTSINLRSLSSALLEFEALPPAVVQAVESRIATLQTILDKAPKSARWKMRARVGTRVRWYEEVAEVD